MNKEDYYRLYSMTRACNRILRLREEGGHDQEIARLQKIVLDLAWQMAR